MLAQRREAVNADRDRMSIGVQKLDETDEIVADRDRMSIGVQKLDETDRRKVYTTPKSRRAKA